MIRSTLPEDFPTLISLAEATGAFKPAEIVALGEVLDDWHSHNEAAGHRCITSLRDNVIVGFAYYAPASMTDRTWYLYWIAVSKQVHARGLGSELLKCLEQDIEAANGRILLIETSSLEHYSQTRRFYLKHGYHHTCRLSDYYADGDHMEVYCKRMSGG
jgi:ribosomal protein S18 acetylase RimI-like enzyme